ncbi:MAG TPA: rhomboid family intramembrane serine protease [Rhodocyclaceae bacterium]
MEPIDAQQTPESLRFAVAFHTFLARDSRFRGSGEIRIDDEQLRVKGRRFMRLWAREESYDLAAVRNVRHDGKAVYFTLPLSRHRQWRAVLSCASEAEAIRLCQALPDGVDSALYTPQEAQREMHSRLNELSPWIPVTSLLTAINVLVYLVLGNKGAGWATVSADKLLEYGGNFSALTSDGQWWRMVTAMFMHGGFSHLAFNMIALYLFGRTVERIHGPLPYLALYLAAGLAGGAATLLTKPAVVSVGASGAIFGLLGLLVAFYLADRSFLPAQARNTLAANAAVFAIYSLVQGFGNESIDNAAHIGGLLCGFLCGLIVGTPARLRPAEAAGSGRLGLALSLTGAGVVVTLLLAPDVRPDYRHHLALIELSQQVAQADQAVKRDMQNMAERARQGGVSDTEALSILETQAQRYGHLEARLHGLAPRTAGLHQRRDGLMAYVTLRREAFETLRVSALANDETGKDKFFAKMKESSSAVEKITAQTRWYP